MCFQDEGLIGSSQPESAALQQFNKSWAELTDWLKMMDNMVQNKQVVVADLDDINDNISQLKVRIVEHLKVNRAQANCMNWFLSSNGTLRFMYPSFASGIPAGA